MKKTTSAFLIFLGVICSVLMTNMALYAQEQYGAKLTVVATINPTRIIVVNDDLQIIKVVSNTDQDIRPIVVRGSEDGPEVAYGDSIIQQYQDLKGSLDFSKPGVLYQKDNRPVQAFLSDIFSRIKKFFQISL